MIYPDPVLTQQRLLLQYRMDLMAMFRAAIKMDEDNTNPCAPRTACIIYVLHVFDELFPGVAEEHRARRKRMAASLRTLSLPTRSKPLILTQVPGLDRTEP